MQRQKLNFVFFLLLSAWVGGIAGDAVAQGAKQIVISTAAGGGLDTLIRKLSGTQALRSSWGNPILTDNRAGQNGLVATGFSRRLPADGSAILAVYITESGANAAAFAPTVTELAEFVPIAYLGSNTGSQGKSWYGIYGPPGMSADTAKRLESAIQSAMQSSEIAAVTATFPGWQQDRAVSAATLAQLTASKTSSSPNTQVANHGRDSGQTAPITTGESAACRCLSLTADAAGEIIRNTCSREIVVFLCVEGYNCRGERSHTNSGVTPKGTTGSFPDHFRVRNEHQGKRQRWGYGAAFRDGLAPTAASMSWPVVQTNRLVCSENREPVIVPWKVNQVPEPFVYAMNQH